VTVHLPFIEGTHVTPAHHFNLPFSSLPEPKSRCPCTYIHWGSCAGLVKDAPALLFLPKCLSNGFVHTPRQRQRWLRVIQPGSLDSEVLSLLLALGTFFHVLLTELCGDVYPLRQQPYNTGFNLLLSTPHPYWNTLTRSPSALIPLHMCVPYIPCWHTCTP